MSENLTRYKKYTRSNKLKPVICNKRGYDISQYYEIYVKVSEYCAVQRQRLLKK